jgi:hypothetical protein
MIEQSEKDKLKELYKKRTKLEAEIEELEHVIFEDIDKEITNKLAQDWEEYYQNGPYKIGNDGRFEYHESIAKVLPYYYD